MTRLLSIALALFALSACDTATEANKQKLIDTLVLKHDVEFRDLEKYPGDVLCGEFSAYFSLHDSRSDYLPFIVVGEEAYKTPSRRQQRIYCSDDPAAELHKRTGIGPFTADNQVLHKITRDLVALATALEAYYKDNYVYPSMEQGLEALVSASEVGRPPRTFRPGGYIDAVPNDPWDRPYIYTEDQWGGSKGRFDLATLGADNAKGGDGDNADVRLSKHLQYLEHLAQLAAP